MDLGEVGGDNSGLIGCCG